MTWVSVTYNGDVSSPLLSDYGSFLYIPFVSYEKGIVTRHPSHPSNCLSGSGERSNGALIRPLNDPHPATNLAVPKPSRSPRPHSVTFRELGIYIPLHFGTFR